MEPDERVGILLRDLLDLDAALRREHEERLLRAAVERDREVVLASRCRMPARSRACGRRGRGCRGRGCRAPSASASSGSVGELDAAGLAAPAGQHLRLDDDRAAELLGRLARLLGRRGEPPLRDGDPERAGRAPCPGTRRDPPAARTLATRRGGPAARGAQPRTASSSVPGRPSHSAATLTPAGRRD